MASMKQESSGVTFRAVALAIFLIPLNNYWVLYMETGVMWMQYPTTMSIFFNAVFILFSLTCLNLIARKWLPRWAFGQGELITIYIMLNLASAVCATDMIQVLMPMLGHSFWFASPENEWQELFGRYIPEWLTVSDTSVLSGYYNGESTLYEAYKIKAWLSPMLWWTGFSFALLFVMFCVNVIVRRQWTEREKLSYPIAQLPYELTVSDSKKNFFKNRLFWIAFGAFGAIDVLNGLNFFFPSVPRLLIRTNLISFFTEKPFSAIGWTPFALYPFVVGLSYFMPLDLSFSCWFFYLFRKAIQVFAAATGWGQLPGAPFLIEQAWGAWMAFAGLAAYGGRRHLAMVWRTAWNRPGGIDDSREPMRYRFALGGLALGLAYLTGFWVKAGGSIWPIGLYFILYYALFSAVSKMRAEIGPPTHELGSMATTRMVGEIFGTKSLGAGTLVSFAMLWFNNRMVRSHQMPIQLEGFKMGERSGIDYKKLGWAMMAAVTMGLLSGYWALLSDAYNSKGARGTGFAGESFRQLQGWLVAPRGPEPLHIAFIGGGALFALLLGAARMRITGWPFHPAGYALGMVFGLDYVWMPILIAWAGKGILLRYGGLRAHAAVIPFICGLILGEFVVGSFWSSLSVLLDKPMYTFWIF